MKVFSGAIQHVKFEHRSPDKIERYIAHCFSKMENSKTSAIDIKRYSTRNGVRWREQLITSGHLGSSFILLINLCRKNGHPVFFAILEQGVCDNYIEPP
jgi:hypothetical protein